MKTTMMTLLPIAAACALSIGAITGCEEVPEYVEDSSDETQFRGTGGDDDGGFDFNTNMLLGLDVPWVDPTGEILNNIELLGVAVDDGGWQEIELESLRVDHGNITGDANNIHYSADEFEGSRWLFDVDGSTVEVELSEVSWANAQGLTPQMDPERALYKFTYDDPDDGTPQQVPTCAVDPEDGGVWMVMHNDFVIDNVTAEVVDRSNTIVFACLSSAMGKPARFNLAPGNPTEPGFDDLSDYQAAVRMYRADYCGNGGSFTVPGKPITFRDYLGLNDFTNAPGFRTEAQWTPDGATCVNKIRRTNQTLTDPLECPDGTTIPLCGDESDAKQLWDNDAPTLWTKTPILVGP